MIPLIAPPLSPSLSRTITLAITRGGFIVPIRRRSRRRPIAFHAYMERVNDDGYPVRAGDHHQGEPGNGHHQGEPGNGHHQGERPRAIAAPRPTDPAPAESPKDREARIRYHQWRVAQRL